MAQQWPTLLDSPVAKPLAARQRNRRMMKMEGLDQQTLWITAVLVVLYFGTRYVIPRIVAAGAAFVDIEEIGRAHV